MKSTNRFAGLAVALLCTAGRLPASPLLDEEVLFAEGVAESSRDLAGWSVAISGSYAIAGAPRDDDDREDGGAVYFYERDDAGQWHQTQKVVPDAVTAGLDRRGFGAAVAISGTRAVVGSRWRSGLGIASPLAGGERIARVFERNASGIWNAVAELEGDVANEFFGISVAISGSRIVVGDFGEGAAQGAAYVFERLNGVWQRVAKLTPPAGDAGGFGWSVAVRSVATLTGNYIAVGAPFRESVYVYVRTSDGQWAGETTLTASDGFDGNQFGYAVALSGTRLVVGAPRDRAPGDSSGIWRGAAYVFDRVGSGFWPQQAKLAPSDLDVADAAGASVAVLGSRIVVGTTTADRFTSGSVFPVELTYPEAAYVYDRTAQGAWVETVKIDGPVAAEITDFGTAVALGSDVLMVGAPRDPGRGFHAGAIQFIVRDATSAAWVPQSTHYPLDAAREEGFAQALAIDGDHLVVAAHLERDLGMAGAGRAYVFARGTDGWRAAATLFPLTDSGAGPPTSVDLDDSWALMGVPGFSGSEPEGGMVRIFRRQVDGDWTGTQDLLPPTAASGLRFGAGVSVHGERMLVGTSSPIAYLYERTPTGTWVEWEVLTSATGQTSQRVAIHDQVAMVGDPLAQNRGAVEVFTRQVGGSWPHTQRLVDAAPTAGDLFGWAIATDGIRLVVGDPANAGSGSVGVAHVYLRDGSGQWQLETTLTPDAGQAFDAFGFSVAIEGARILVGAPRGEAGGRGFATLFERDGEGVWSETGTYQIAAAAGDDDYGSAVAMSGQWLVAGDPADAVNGTAAGAARIGRIFVEAVFRNGFESESPR